MVIHSRQARTLVAFLAFAALIAFGVAACESTSAKSPVSPSSAAIGGDVLNAKPGTLCELAGSDAVCRGVLVGAHCHDSFSSGLCRLYKNEPWCICR